MLLQDYRSAIALAFQMNQPRRLLQLFTQVAASRPEEDAIASMERLFQDALGTADAQSGSITGLATVDDILRDLPRSQLAQLLVYVRDWNTSARTSPIAQLVLHAIVRQWDAESILDAIEDARASLQVSAVALLEGLVPYTERHYARVDRMLVESAMLEYTLQAMDTIIGE